MTRHTDDVLIDEALRSLDPAPRVDLTDAEKDRAEAAFARIVAAAGGEPSLPGKVRTRRGRRRLLAAALVACAAGVAIPALLVGGTAYGSWTPTPQPLTAQASAEAASTCRAMLDVTDRGERVAVAEQRGRWTYVLLAGPRVETACLMPDDLVGQDSPGPGAIFGSHDADAPAAPVLGPSGFDETTSMQGKTDEGWFIWVAGYVGGEVTGVTVHTSSGTAIEASIEGGRFAAWWPATAQSSKRPAETWSYTVHLADGSDRAQTGSGR